MIEHKVYDETYLSLVAGRNQLIKILKSSILRVNLLIICNIVFMVCWRWRNRHKPDLIAAKIASRAVITVIYIIKLIYYTAKITNAIPVTVIKRVNEYLIGSAVLVIQNIEFLVCNIIQIKRISACNSANAGICIHITAEVRACADTCITT